MLRTFVDVGAEFDMTKKRTQHFKTHVGKSRPIGVNCDVVVRTLAISCCHRFKFCQWIDEYFKPCFIVAVQWWNSERHYRKKRSYVLHSIGDFGVVPVCHDNDLLLSLVCARTL